MFYRVRSGHRITWPQKITVTEWLVNSWFWVVFYYISSSTDPFHERGISMILCAPRLNRPPRPGLPLVLNGLNLTVRAGSLEGKGGFVDWGRRWYSYIPWCVDCGWFEGLLVRILYIICMVKPSYENNWKIPTGCLCCLYLTISDVVLGVKD